jgi:hypothetical protein
MMGDYGRDIWQAIEAMKDLIKKAKDGHPVPMTRKHFVDLENSVHFAIKAAQDKILALNEELKSLTNID